MNATSVITPKIFNLKRNIPQNILIAILVAFISGVLLWISLSMEMGQFVIAAILGIFYLYFCIKYPKFWIYSIAATSMIYFQPGDADVTAFEIIHGGFFSISGIVWIFWMIFIKKEKIVKNVADWLFLFFIIMLLFSLPMAIFNENNILNWFREFVLISVMLLYFPIRHHIDNKKDLTILLLIFMFSMFLTDVHQLIQYRRNAIQDAVYAFQLGASIRMKQPIFSMSIIVGFLFTLYQKTLIRRLFMLGFTCLTTMGLLVSFSRTFWVMVAVAIFVSWLYLNKDYKIKSINNVLIILAMIIISIIFVFKENSNVIFTIIEKRIASTGKGTKDLSIQMRMQEYESVWQSIDEFPLGGKGLGTTHEYYQSYNTITLRTLNVHNGYLYFIYRIGYPLIAFFIIPIVYYIFKAERLARKTDDAYLKILLLGSFSSLILMLTANFMAAVFNSRDGTFLFILSISFISISEQIIESKKNQRLLQ